jgi:4-amino-4-deoxy-L-arabinose transferase-like glycosyltransferase
MEPGDDPQQHSAVAQHPHWSGFDLAALLILFLTMGRVAATWTVFSATIDEPVHISAALELYEHHRYALQQENPPLPRVVFGLPAWLGGMTFDESKNISEQLRMVFFTNDRYKTNLVLARSGNLLFLILAAYAVWAWARRTLGPHGAVLAVFLFCLQPMVSGFAGLATHDMAATAGVGLSLLAFVNWMDTRTRRAAALFGVAFGFAVLCKFSCIGYVPAACFVMVLARSWREPSARSLWRAVPAALSIAILGTAATIAVGYALQPAAFLEGIRKLFEVAQAGHTSFLLGKVSSEGWWFYFPIALALKTTIASLLLMLSAVFLRRSPVTEALVAAVAILAVAMTSRLDLGVRYILPIYVPLSVAAAGCVIAMVGSGKPWLRIAATSLLLWHAGTSIVAGADTFPYFNAFAGSTPWRILNDSNIDWGQDVLRLRDVARQERIPAIQTSIASISSIDHLGLPARTDVQALQPLHGWVAISEFNLAMGRGISPEIRNWIDQTFETRPYQRVGTSIRLYRFD